MIETKWTKHVKVCKFSQGVRQMFLCRLESETFIIYQSFVFLYWQNLISAISRKELRTLFREGRQILYKKKKTRRKG